MRGSQEATQRSRWFIGTDGGSSMFRRLLSLIAAGTLVALPLATAVPSSAVPPKVDINFEGEPTGSKPNGYSTAAQPEIRFYDTNGSSLTVAAYGSNQSNGIGLGVHPDDSSALEIRLPKPTLSVSLAFGNDDPIVVDSTDLAQLTVFRGATQVGQTVKNVNANDVMDQRIRFKGKLFNRVVFQYVDAAQNPVNLIEIVDDIKFDPLCTKVGTSGRDVINGTSGPDVLCGDKGADTIRGRGGSDLIIAGPGADTVKAGGGADEVLAGKGGDTVKAGAGADLVLGGNGRDDLFGNRGKDNLKGGTQRDFCNGGPGKDKASSCEVKKKI